MNHLRLVTLFVTLCVLSGFQVMAKTCGECPPYNPCSYTYLNECNTCTGITWCENDQWYSDGLGWCTAMACSGYGHKIDNPFGERW